MKELLIITLFVLGMCNASVFGMEQEIILTDIYSIMPLDDPSDEEVKITSTGSLEVINGGTVTIEYLTMEEGSELNIH